MSFLRIRIPEGVLRFGGVHGLVAMIALAAGGLARGEFETWTSADGRQSTMMLVEVIEGENGKTGRFSLRGGRVFEIPASELSADDARRLAEWSPPAEAGSGGGAPLFTQSGTDPTFAELLASGALRPGANRNEGVTGSKIKVANARVETTAYARRSIARDIRIHTLAHSSIARRNFGQWTRWYQEDGNTQVFRLFKDETNVRNNRPNAPRIESFSTHNWKAGGGWHEWTGTYTIIKPVGCAIFQVMNRDNEWAVHLGMNGAGDISLNHRRGPRLVIARNMTGKPFDIRVRDNGHDYEVFLNGEQVAAGKYARPTGVTNFRWGMYLGSRPMPEDAMIFVSGATVRAVGR